MPFSERHRHVQRADNALGERRREPLQSDRRDFLAMKRSGSCLCGAIRYEVSGEPLRIGLCHCLDCQKETGSAFVTFGVWPAEAFSASGEVATFAGRRFCPTCGARVFTDRQGKEAEIRIGSLDGIPEGLFPTYEVWVKRRQPWLLALPWTDQFQGDRPPAECTPRRSRSDERRRSRDPTHQFGHRHCAQGTAHNCRGRRTSGTSVAAQTTVAVRNPLCFILPSSCLAQWDYSAGCYLKSANLRHCRRPERVHFFRVRDDKVAPSGDVGRRIGQ